MMTGMSIRCPTLPNIAAACEPAPAIDLAVGATASARGRRGVRLECLSGTVWATRSGDAHDHVLRAGGMLTANGGVRIALQALDAARVRFVAM